MAELDPFVTTPPEPPVPPPRPQGHPPVPAGPARSRAGETAYRNPVRVARRSPPRRPAAEVDPQRVRTSPEAQGAGGIVTPLGALPLRLEDGQIWAYLPFRVDTERLTRFLREEGYPMAYDPGARDPAEAEAPPGTQGWGPGYDSEGYYPYWVFPDPEAPERSVFALVPRPEDVVTRRDGAQTVQRPEPGPVTRSLLAHWLPVLRWCAEAGVDR
ncbi:MAG: hypothetical protein L6E13_11545 [Firmicutes bacterium]|nr:hypothetical protein [Bacillota bacterium]